MKLLKILAVLLCFCVNLAPGPGVAFAAFAPLNPAYIEYMRDAEDGSSPMVRTAGSSHSGNGMSSFGYIPSPLSWAHLDGKVWNVAMRNVNSTSAASGTETSIPTSYDLRKQQSMLPEVRNQYELGNCWAYSAMAATESNLIKNGLADSEIELSEWYLTYYAFHDFIGMPAFTVPGTAKYYDAGGNDWQAVALLSRGTGSVCAATVKNINTVEAVYTPPIVKRKYRLNQAFYLGNSGKMEIPVWQTYGRAETLKRALMLYGALSAGIYADDRYRNTTTDAYYTGLNYGSDGDGVSTNHAVTLVGWDDSYSRQNFQEGNQPEQDGAWIVRNSWGSGWGDGGYFYVSYEEKTLCDGVAYVTSEAAAEDRIYQYDPLGCVTWFTPYDDDMQNEADVWFANIFTAENIDRITSVAFYVPQAGTEYEIAVYRNCREDAPLSGEKAAAVTTDGLLPGYNTVTFEEPVQVQAGEHFSVVVKTHVTYEDYQYVVPIETDIFGGVYSQAESEPGEGWVSEDGISFYDIMDWVESGQHISICLKAFGEGEYIAQSNPPSLSGTAPNGVAINAVINEEAENDALDRLLTGIYSGATDIDGMDEEAAGSISVLTSFTLEVSHPEDATGRITVTAVLSDPVDTGINRRLYALIPYKDDNEKFAAFPCTPGNGSITRVTFTIDDYARFFTDAPVLFVAVKDGGAGGTGGGGCSAGFGALALLIIMPLALKKLSKL